MSLCADAEPRTRAGHPATVAIVTLMCAAVLALASAAAPTPAVMVDAFEYELGDVLTVTASGLAPADEYEVEFVGPGGQAVQETVRSDAGGNLRASHVLDEAGAWTVGVTGARVSARLGVQVVAGEAPPGAQPGPAGPAEGAEPAEGAQDEAQAEPEPPAATEEQAPEGEEPREEPGEGPVDVAPEGPAEGEEDQQDQSPSDPAPSPALPGAAPLPPASQARNGIEVAIEQGDVVGRRSGVEAWRLSFGPDSGQTAGLLERAEDVLVGHGNSMLTLDRLTGAVQARDRLPAQVMAIAESGDEVVVTVRYAAGATAQVPWPPERPLAFDPDPALYRWLRAEAEVPDPVAQLSRDPSNPWLYLAAARAQPDRAEALRRSALSRARTFYELAQLANAFMAEPPRDEALASQAMDAALVDFVGRGYRGSLLVDEALSNAYGFPRARLRQALAAGDEAAADFWAPWLFRLVGDGGPETRQLLSEYADSLARAGETDAAATWRERAAAAGGSDPLTTLERAAATVGRTGWYGVLALLVAAVALRLTLLAKYWRAQTLRLRQRRESGQTTGRLSRGLSLRYATFTEKLVMLLLFAAIVAVAALSGWVADSRQVPVALGSGSLATPVGIAALEAAPDHPDKTFALAYAAQSDGDAERATELYRQLTSDPDAMNNLGVLRGERQLYELALEVDPAHPEASYNLGQAPNPSRLMQAYRPDAPLLAAPDAVRLSRAFNGGPWGALGAAFTNPFAALVELGALTPRWAWAALVVLFLAWVAWTLISLAFPRPATARNAPRTLLYHLLALVLPGSGLADELWGVLLLVPWAIFGIDLLHHLLDLGAPASMSFTTDVVALVVIYVINTAAFVVEFASYRRRMRALRVDHPEVAAAYGLRP